MFAGTVILVSMVIVAVVFALDRFFLRKDEVRDELVDGLRANYLEALDIAAKHPSDSRLKALSSIAGHNYYKEAIDGNILISPDKIDEFIESVCDLEEAPQKAGARHKAKSLPVKERVTLPRK